MPRQRSGPPGHQGRERPGQPDHLRGEDHRLRMRCQAEGWL